MAAIEEFTKVLDDPGEGSSGEKYVVREVYRLAKNDEEAANAVRYVSIEGSYVLDRLEILLNGEWKPLGPVLSSRISVGRCP